MSDEQYKRDEAAYRENCAFARGINTQLMQIPTFAITLTGGLWLGAALSQNVEQGVKAVLLFFAVIADVALIVVLFRLRDVFKSYMEKIKAFNTAAFADGRPEGAILGNYAMVTAYSIVLGLAAVISLIGAVSYACAS